MKLFASFWVASAAWAQVGLVGPPRVDLIEFYGLHRVTPTLAQQALGLSEGSILPASKGDTEDRLLDIDRVVTARLEAVCCDGGKTVLYVGIQERDAPFYETRPAPGGAALLPDSLITEYRRFEQSERARGRSELGYEMLSQPARVTAAFPDLEASRDLMREVLRESGDEYHRGVAAYLLPYLANKAEIVEDLRVALMDSDANVRANSVRALAALAQYGQVNPASRVRVPPAWFVDLLQSVTWSDRMQAVRVLEPLSRDRDVVLLSSLGGATLDSLVEMARWKTEQHAYPAFMLVGRVAGLTDLNIRDAWLRGGFETVIAQARQKTR